MQRHLLVRGGYAALLLTAAVQAQLAGAYGIDSAQPTGAGNYNTFQDAANDLALQGVSGPVQFFVAPGAAPYVGFSIVAPIVGASAVNVVEFYGSNVVAMAGVAAGFAQVIHLGTNTATGVNGTSFITIDGFDITAPAAGAGISAGGSSNIIIRNCVVHGANTGSGISIVNSNNCLVENNEVYNVAATPGVPGSNLYSGGISVYYATTAVQGGNNVVTRNKVHDCLNQGIFVGSSGSATAPPNITITNNMVWNCVGTGTYPGGIAIRRSGSSVISHNSVYMTSGTVAGINKMGSNVDPNPAELSNNIVKHDGTGPCIRFETATTNAPTVFNNNCYDPGATAVVGQIIAVNYATLAAWQAAAPVVGFEGASVQGIAGYVGATDLHITPASAGFNAGSVVASVTVDLDLDLRPLGGIPDIGADETPVAGLFTSFSVSTQNGPAALSVSFTDLTFSSDVGGVTSWAWDFQNDGIIDSVAQNPVFVYACPGVYSVALTTTDASNPSSTVTKFNHITVTQFKFDLATTGGGVGDLTVTPVPTSCGSAVGSVLGYTFLSFTPATPVGLGPFFGITPDAVFFLFLSVPLGVGNPTAFIIAPGFFPDAGPLALPAGTLAAFAGATMDAVQVFLGPASNLVHYSNTDRVVL